MPYCVQCGNQVQDSDVFCGNCGSRQRDGRGGSGGGGATTGGGAGANPFGAGTDFAASITPRTASLLCYIPVVGWIGAIFVLAATRFRDDRNTRFHAWQGLYLFVAWLLIEWVLEPFFSHVPGPVPFVNVFKAVVMVGWIVMLVKTSQEQMFHLPIIGELAERSVAEQR